MARSSPRTLSHSRPGPHARIDPFDLRLFAAVVEAGTITAGAREVHLSLAAASTRLQQLEHGIGALLLRRSKLGVTPTDAGRTLLRHAGRLQRELEAMHAEMAAHAHDVRSTVRLLTNTAAMHEDLPPLLGRFLVQHPDIDVDLRELSSPDALHAMHQERAEIGILADHVDTAGLRTRPFGNDRLVAVVPRGVKGVRSGRDGLAFASLLGHPFVGLPPDRGLSRFLHTRASRHGRGLHHRVCVPSLETVLGLVADGVGVAVVPERTARRRPDDRFRVHRLADEWAVRRMLLCTANEALGAGAAELFDCLATAAREADDDPG